MDTNSSSNHIHPLMAAAAVSVSLLCVVGTAAIAGLLPNSHGAVADTPSMGMVNGDNSRLAQQATPAPVVREVVRYKTVVRHEYLPRHEIARDDGRNQAATAERFQDYRPASAYQQPAAAPQISPLGVGIGALLGGLVGNHVGHGNGRALATIAGAVGGGYLGNEIAQRNQALVQQ